MKKIMRYTWPLALGGLLVSPISVAGFLSKHTVAELCRNEAQQLNHIIESKPLDKCAGDVAVAGAYLDAAGTKLGEEHYDEALVSLHYSEMELKQIAYSRAYCAQVASRITPAIAQVIKISRQLDVLERMTTKPRP